MATVPINDVTPENKFVATLGQTIFPYTYFINQEGDLKVFQNQTLLTLNIDYTVTLPQTPSGGNVVLTVGAASADSIVIVRDSIIERLTEFQTSGAYFASAVNLEYTYGLVIDQDLRRKIEDSLRLADFEIENNDMQLPALTGNDGNILQLVDTAGTFSFQFITPSSLFGSIAIPDGAVTNVKIAPDAVTTDKILDGTILLDDLDATTIASLTAGSGANLNTETFTASGSETSGPVGTFIAGTSTTVTLSATPADEDSLEIFFDGSHQFHTDYTLSGSVVTFNATIGGGVSEIEVRIVEGLAVGTPSNNSVGLAQLAGGTQNEIISFDASGDPEFKTVEQALKDETFTNTTIVADDKIMFFDDDDSDNVKIAPAQGILDLVSSATVQDNIAGLVLSNDADTSHDINITSGQAADSTNVSALVLPSETTKRIDATWLAGNDSGGLFSGTVAADTTYHVFIIEKDSDSSIDAGFDTSLTAANIPAGYTKFRRIGSIITDSSSNIINFVQTGDYFFFKVAIQEFSGAYTTTASILTTSVPAGVKMIGIFSTSLTSDSSRAVYLTDPDITDTAPAVAGPLSHAGGSQGGARHHGAQSLCVTNSSGQIRHRATATNTGDIFSYGWIDFRGK